MKNILLVVGFCAVISTVSAVQAGSRSQSDQRAAHMSGLSTAAVNVKSFAPYIDVTDSPINPLASSPSTRREPLWSLPRIMTESQRGAISANQGEIAIANEYYPPWRTEEKIAIEVLRQHIGI